MNEFPKTTMATVSNLWFRQMVFEASGDRNEGHVHNFDHCTLVAKGRVAVHVEGKITEFDEGSIIVVSKGQSHFIEALTDGAVAYCVHAIRNGERVEDIIPEGSIPAGSLYSLEDVIKHGGNVF